MFTDFYNSAEIEGAKLLLIDLADKCTPKLDELKKIKPRVGEGKSRRDMEDILGIYTALDAWKEDLPLFLAADTARIPSLRDIDVSKIAAEFNADVSIIESGINTQFDKLNAVVTQMTTAIETQIMIT